MDYKWNVLSDNKIESIQTILKQILEWKEIDKNDVRNFIECDINPYDPFQLTNMDKAITRINQAIENEEKICIIGDYDADGVTATSIMYIGLKHLYANTTWLIPDRELDGYGMNKRLINIANDNDCDLIITVDNGISCKDEIDYAKSLEMDVVVTDHHEIPQEGLPTEICVNPQNGNYPFESIAGCMVAFKVIQGLIPNLREYDYGLYEELVSILAIGTVADVMEIVDENRYYVNKGLRFLSKPKNIGLKALAKEMDKYGKQLSTTDISFSIGPCINATGRLEKADIAVDLLLCEDSKEAEKIAQEIIEINEKRKDLQKEIVDSIEVNADDDFIIVNSSKINKGLAGIIAGKISNQYQRPCFVLSEYDGKLSGSGRSIYGYSINSCVQSNLDIVSGGGHAEACGVTLKKDNLKDFRQRCNEHFSDWRKTASMEDMTPTLNIISEINLSLANMRLINNINKLKPFGYGNKQPLFMARDLTVTKSKVVGKNKNVMQFKFEQNGYEVKGVGFSGIKEKYEELGSPNKVNAVFVIELNEWPKGNFNPQLVIKDLKTT
jgi:single-stranded-DNA-specific exonuclease